MEKKIVKKGNKMGRNKKYNICLVIIDTLEKLKRLNKISKGIRKVDKRRKKIILHIEKTGV